MLTSQVSWELKTDSLIFIDGANLNRLLVVKHNDE